MRGRRATGPSAAPNVPERLRRLDGARPTYGYRRITAVLNRELAAAGEPRANHKRVHRLMKTHALLLGRRSGDRPGRTHDGKVVVMRWNLRRRSDRFEVACRNGEAVRGAFVIEAMTARPSPGGRDRRRDQRPGRPGHHARGRRGPLRHRPRTVTDRVAARQRFALHRQGHAPLRRPAQLAPCFTPVASPESNGLAEAFVKTFKRDHLTFPLDQGRAELESSVSG